MPDNWPPLPGISLERQPKLSAGFPIEPDDQAPERCMPIPAIGRSLPLAVRVACAMMYAERFHWPCFQAITSSLSSSLRCKGHLVSTHQWRLNRSSPQPLQLSATGQVQPSSTDSQNPGGRLLQRIIAFVGSVISRAGLLARSSRRRYPRSSPLRSTGFSRVRTYPRPNRNGSGGRGFPPLPALHASQE